MICKRPNCNTPTISHRRMCREHILEDNQRRAQTQPVTGKAKRKKAKRRAAANSTRSYQPSGGGVRLMG